MSDSEEEHNVNGICRVVFEAGTKLRIIPALICPFPSLCRKKEEQGDSHSFRSGTGGLLSTGRGNSPRNGRTDSFYTNWRLWKMIETVRITVGFIIGLAGRRNFVPHSLRLKSLQSLAAG